MLTVTPAAAAKMRQVMSGADNAIRIGVVGGGCSGFSYAMKTATLDDKGPMDKELEFEGVHILVDATSAMYLKGATIDYLETLEESGFKFSNPNAKTTCGCGSSFSA